MTPYQRKLRRLLVVGSVTLLTTTVLVLYLLPFGYMGMTSLKNPRQIVRNTVLPLTQRTYEYQGEEFPGYRVVTGTQYPIYFVPDGERERILALVKAATEDSPNIFIDPNTLKFVEWEGDTTTLAPAPQISLFTAIKAVADADSTGEYGVVVSRRYPVFEVDTDEGVERWALVRTPKYAFIDINNPNGGVIEWEGDLTTLSRAQQIFLYQYKGQTHPEGLVIANRFYPLYHRTDTEQDWALVRGPNHIFVDTADPDAGAFEWEGSLESLTLTDEKYKHFSALNRARGLLQNVDYPVYQIETDDGPQRWALVREGTGTDESLFINTSNANALEYAVFSEDIFKPITEDGILLYSPKFNERIYGLETLGNFPVYSVPTDDGDQSWALVREGTGTDESIFINVTNVTSSTNPDEVEFIRAPIDLSTLRPALEPESKYRHGTSPLPSWSVLKGDELLLYEAPIEGYGEEWALVAPGTPGITPTYFVSPSHPDAGIFEYNDQWIGTLGTIDDIDPQWGNFEEAWTQIRFPRLLFNTLAIAVIGMIGTLISCTLVAYGFARFPIPYKNTIFMILIATIILPRQVTLVPTFAFFSKIGWTNTWLPLLVPHFFANAYNVFLLRQFFQTIPRDMDEAAMIDGAGPFRILRSVILPQAYPALVAAGLFHFVFAWNDYFEPLIYLLGKPELQPISVGVQQFNFVFGQEPHLIQSAALMAMILPILLFFFAQRFFIQGIVITGVDK